MSLRLAYLKQQGYVKDDGDLRHTKVTNFCLPMIGLHRRDFKGKLLNVYIQHTDEQYLYIVVLNTDDEDVVKVLKKINDHEDFVESFNDDDNKELVFVVKVPKKHEDDYYKILNGLYSEISQGYKNILKVFYTNNVYDLNDAPLIVNGQVATTMWEILNPSVRKREIVAKHFEVDIKDVKELMSKPDLKYEVYKNIKDLNNDKDNV